VEAIDNNSRMTMRRKAREKATNAMPALPSENIITR
jgi:hypothetical protein